MKKTFVILLLFFLSGCLEAPKGRLPSINQSEIDKEADRQKRISYSKYINQMSLVKNIGYKINAANSDICKNKDYISGITYANEYSIGKEISEYFPNNLNLGSQVTIIDIVKNSPAEKSGLQIGDKIIKYGDYEFPEGKKALTQIFKDLKKVPKQESQIIIVDRGGESKTFEFNAEKICNYQIILTQDRLVNAFADGERVIMTQGIVDYAKDENEIALVIGHEIAHNDRGHIDAKKKNTAIMGSIGFIIDMMAIYYSGGAAGGDAQNTKAWSQLGAEAFSVEFEKDADYGGVYYAARAGYDVSNSNKFWERMGAEDPKKIAFVSTHPATSERYLQIRKTVDEISDKKTKGLPIIPNEKEDLKAKSNESADKKKKLDLKKLFKK